jgi:hypothetical protein
MSKEKSRVIGIEMDDLKDEIRVAVRNEFETCIQDCRFGTEFIDEVWDRKKVAAFLQITPENVSAGVKNKQIPGRKIGREYRFLKSQIIGLFKKKAA